MTSEFDSSASSTPEHFEQFMGLFLSHQRQLYRFIVAMLPNERDAEDLLQETAMVLWRKREEYTPNTNFQAWARQVARYKVLEWRRKRDSELITLDDDVLELVAADFERHESKLQAQQEAMEFCVERLKPQDQDLIRRRYADGLSGQQIAEELDRPTNSIFQSLARIRRALLECIRRRLESLARGGDAS